MFPGVWNYTKYEVEVDPSLLDDWEDIIVPNEVSVSNHEHKLNCTEHEELINTAERTDKTEKFHWKAKSGAIKTMRLFSGSYGVEKIIADEESTLGVSEVKDRGLLTVPEGLKMIKTRVGEDYGGSFLAEIIMEGKTTEKSESFATWGNWKETELKQGEYLIGLSLECFTVGNYKSLKSFSYIIGSIGGESKECVHPDHGGLTG